MPSSGMTVAMPIIKPNDRNPDAVRTVTIIVTHEDSTKDYCDTFTANQLTDFHVERNIMTPVHTAVTYSFTGVDPKHFD